VVRTADDGDSSSSADISARRSSYHQRSIRRWNRSRNLNPCRAIDLRSRVVDVLLSTKRDRTAAARYSSVPCRQGRVPVEITTDRKASFPRVLDELLPAALHIVAR
jgi:hypothetical protein